MLRKKIPSDTTGDRSRDLPTSSDNARSMDRYSGLEWGGFNFRERKLEVRVNYASGSVPGFRRFTCINGSLVLWAVRAENFEI